ncbi:MAG: P-loop NTPase [Candidatus Zixiibacteriota bacterium]
MVDSRLTTSNIPALISVLSGKGGVGKSIIALNLADQLSMNGYRVLLVDADINAGTLHILANAAAEFGFHEYSVGSHTLAQSVTPITSSLHLLAASDGNLELSGENRIHSASLVSRLRADSKGIYDAIIVDHGSGRTNHSATLAHASDLNILVTIPELTSLTGAYALYKFLVKLDRGISAALVINRTRSEEEIQYIENRFAELSEKFLGQSPQLLGSISEHESVRRAIASQTVLSQVDGSQAVNSQFEEIANTLATNLLPGRPAGRIDINSTINKSSATADTRG